MCVISSDLGSRWWRRGTSSSQLANSIIELLKELASGQLCEQWTAVAKGAVAENILALTRMDESLRAPDKCVRTPTVRQPDALSYMILCYVSVSCLVPLILCSIFAALDRQFHF